MTEIINSAHSQTQVSQDGAIAPVLEPSIDEIFKNAKSILKSIKKVSENVKSSAATIAESESSSKTLLAGAQAKLEEISSAVTQAMAAMTQITDHQAIIATKSDHIQNAQVHADTVRANLDRALTAAKQIETSAESHESSAKSSAETAAEILASTRISLGSIETNIAKITESRKDAEASTELLKKLADKSESVDGRIAEYEKRLEILEARCALQLQTIESLLPGATSAGLAHSFDERRKTFLKPHDLWQKVFVVSVSLIVVIAIYGIWHILQSGVAPTTDELLRLWLSRLPVCGALVWLALHASREAALAKRLEEDYGYKAAIASSFLGFHKQMSEVGSDAIADSPLARLCENTLSTIASPPGRIYDKHKLTVSPTDELARAAKSTVDIINATKQGEKTSTIT